MLGLVSTEFVEWVEYKFSPETAVAVFDEVAAPRGGASTATGCHAAHDGPQGAGVLFTLVKRVP